MRDYKIHEIINKAMRGNIPEGVCYSCKKPIENSNKRQKLHYGGCVIDNKDYGMPVSKRNHKYMFIYLGKGYSRGQGRRYNGMVRGAMSVSEDMWSKPVPVTLKNVKKSLENHERINLCNGVWLDAEEAMVYAEHLESIN